MSISIDLQAPDAGTIQDAARVIRAGGIVLYPSDTIYGLGCDPFNESALSRVFEIKGRSSGQGMLVLVASLEWVDELAVARPVVFDRLAERFWPGPVTMLLQARHHLPRLLKGREGKIGVRFPFSRFLRQWMDRIPGPLVSTSANRSGREPSGVVQELKDEFGGQVDLVLEANQLCGRQPSTVIDLAGDNPYVIREGAQCQEVKHFLGTLGETGF